MRVRWRGRSRSSSGRRRGRGEEPSSLDIGPRAHGLGDDLAYLSRATKNRVDNLSPPPSHSVIDQLFECLSTLSNQLESVDLSSSLQV
jgi:hypothetical protein